MMENGLGDLMEENEADVQTKAQDRVGDDRHRWQNGNSLNMFNCARKMSVLGVTLVSNGAAVMSQTKIPTSQNF